ncbi:pentapeptide repeat-containing protein [Spirillospora sp. NPDC052269]
MPAQRPPGASAAVSAAASALSAASAGGASLAEASLAGASLAGASLAGASLAGASLAGASVVAVAVPASGPAGADTAGSSPVPGPGCRSGRMSCATAAPCPMCRRPYWTAERYRFDGPGTTGRARDRRAGVACESRPAAYVPVRRRAGTEEGPGHPSGRSHPHRR